MGHFGQIVPNNIYNKYVLVAAPSDQASHSFKMFAIIILSLCQIYCPCIRYMISVNLENNDERKMSSRKRLETTLYLRTLPYVPVYEKNFFLGKNFLGAFC
jgi:hypothetical protein